VTKQTRPRVVLAMSTGTRERLLTAGTTERLAAVADVDTSKLITDFRVQRPAGAEILLTGWGAPRVDRAALEMMPELTAIVHAAGSVKSVVAPEVFARGIAVSSAADANAIPVAEFTFAAIIFAAKRVTRLAAQYRVSGVSGASGASRPDTWGTWDLPEGFALGTNGINVGVVGASRVGRRVIMMLRGLDVTTLVADPYLTADAARDLGATRATLDDLIAASDILTLHAPDLPETRGMISGERLARMRDGAVLINTARGALVDTEALTAELVSGRLDAVLDVTDPEPLPGHSPLHGLPNVLLTPHIAGAAGNEVRRLGESAVAEIERLAAGLPFRHPVTAEDLGRIA
jgi:phosphoglycerate dehydrogenase-like enzyme